MGAELLELEAVSYQYAGSAWRLDAVTLHVASGEVVAVIGPNGSGKSTLLRLGAGVVAPTSGRVSLEGREMSGLARREVARTLGYLPQQVASEFDYRVEEVVAMGRYPHLSGAGFLSAGDVAVVDRCLAEAEIECYRGRRLSRLSGGASVPSWPRCSRRSPGRSCSTSRPARSTCTIRSVSSDWSGAWPRKGWPSWW